MISNTSISRRLFVASIAALLTLFVVTGWVLRTASGAATSSRPAGTPVCGDITTSTTWTLTESPYVVCGTYVPTVAQGVTLTIEPGVEVQFEANGRLNVGGTLAATGSVTQPITFTGVIKSPGSWQGLTIAGSGGTHSRGSVLSYVTIEYGGVGSGNSANLMLDTAEVTISHSIFRHGAKHGLHAWTNVVAHIADSSFLDNGPTNPGYAVLFTDGRLNSRLTGLSAASNGVNAVGLGGNALLQGNHLWAEMGLPYVVVGGLTVARDATLTIEPGVEVQFEHFEGLDVAGRLNATGLPARPITFTGTTRSPGWWNGISINGAGDTPATALFDYATVEYGGSSSANLYVIGGQTAFHHGTIRFSGRDGVKTNGATRVTLDASQIVSNTNYGIFNASNAEVDIVNAANNWW